MENATTLLGATLYGVVWGWLAGLIALPAGRVRGPLLAAVAAVAAAATSAFMTGLVASLWTAGGIGVGLLAYGVWRSELRRRAVSNQ